ncbi:microtubule-associated protein Jupiter isoform X2 [Plutella xylostella]|uniref:microtubule-associated protein Jupiter isoform X2 n=1 Tax=Plutella xylostella TaxID=51655 RepID=UPI002032DEBF|nr:microtubule-associated protein Jupiter isoform X2 [Plutella xylostella]
MLSTLVIHEKQKSDSGVSQQESSVSEMVSPPVDLDAGGSQSLVTGDSASTVRVPNAPKSCIAEIFSADKTDGAPMKNGTSRPRAVRDTPTRPRDTHSRLFGQAKNNTVVPMVTDNIRSHIQFGEHERNGGSPMHSPKMNGSASSTPSRAISASPPKRNPVTGDGVLLPPPRRAHPGAAQREGNPITGQGYKSLNGQINTVTSLNGSGILHNRVPPGGYSSGLW